MEVVLIRHRRLVIVAVVGVQLMPLLRAVFVVVRLMQVRELLRELLREPLRLHPQAVRSAVGQCLRTTCCKRARFPCPQAKVFNLVVIPREYARSVRIGWRPVLMMCATS